ncbi:uncharacterized protein LOC131009155 [Salvia miltiorrhiza]|uniref:uncharacterized protein LOC131009155 n=1 Tax=Salvia miltiorrhiza TaxID=226208 RepID=UPI0025AB6FC1|nr:uncharacterized protein LOC131009155 [Salvia miltiorrhiza]
MNSLFWNCRGLGNPSTIRQLVWLAKHKRPEVLFLMETKLFSVEWSPILSQLRFNNFFPVDCDGANGGRRGGLCLIWFDDINIVVKSSSLHHILATVDDGVRDAWDFCGLYGWSITDDHHYTWDLMRSLRTQVSEKWICGGDFNETMFHFEKRGGQPKTDSRLDLFRGAVDDCGLSDLGYIGEPFTWNNNQKDDANIMERLDRVLGSESWILSFHGFEVSHLLRKSSDHCPLLLCLEKEVDDNPYRPKPFRFEAMWLRHDQCKSFEEECWAAGGTISSITDMNGKLEDMGREFKAWEKNVSGHVRKRCSKIRKELTELQKSHCDAATKNDQKQLESELDELLKQDEMMWKQRSRADWLAEGDRNTGFFHRIAEGRKKRNFIREIHGADGTKVRKQEKLDEAFRSHFQELFYSGATHNPDEVLSSIEPVVTNEMNRELTMPYTKAEIVEALKQMHPLKAPGPDGSSRVFRHESQSAFVPGRHITDNALLAFEIFHMMKLNKAKEHEVFAFKLDMAKAYDRVEWGFLKDIMSHLGFASSFVDLILRCVLSVSFQVLVNGFPGSQFAPSRGLLRRAESQKLLHGARICKTAPRFSHLLFADDCIIFGRGNEREIATVKRVINSYEGVSGQLVNLEKSSISFSGGVPEEKKLQLAGLMGVQRTGQRATYLGIPSTVGRSKSEVFQMLIDRTRKKTKDWKRRFLSGAGKMVLIKSVLQSIPSYIMSCFALPSQVCQNLNNVAARFFWGQKNEERRIHWKSWKFLCTTKGSGGLGFRDISLFNQAMLAKQAWRLLTNDSSLLARSLKARHSLELRQWQTDTDRARPLAPNGNGQFLVANVEERHINSNVQMLLLEDQLMWNDDALQTTLQPNDRWKVQAQMRINPLECDKPFWPHGKFNAYSVKSGYNLAIELKQREEASSSNSLNSLSSWIWGLDVIPKVKLFLWKCMVNALPTSNMLRRRGIDVEVICRRCGEKVETVEHALRDCVWVRMLWAMSPLRIQLNTQGDNGSIVDWFEKFCRGPPKEAQALVASLSWSIWYARNLLFFQQNELSHQECLLIASRALWSPPVCSSPQKSAVVTLFCENEREFKISSDVAI